MGFASILTSGLIFGEYHNRYIENLPAFRHCDISKLQGHKQLTDFYLVKLAEYYGMRLLTLDKRLVNSLPSNSSILLLPE